MVRLWDNDDQLFSIARTELFTAGVGDAMDRKGLLRQFLPPEIHPLDRETVVVGRAMTVLEADFFEECSSSSTSPLSSVPFGLMLDALDGLKSNEIYVCTGASLSFAPWGELMSVRAMRCGAAGAVLDGYCRDTKGILKLGFPTFSRGSYAQDQGPRGKVVDYRVPIEIGGVRINPGDIVLGDVDGVCIVPHEAEVEVFTSAIDKARKEKPCRRALEEGMSAKQALEKYGVI